MDKVSIIIPCFNSGKTISKAVNSAKNQTWNNIEIIIVNDGSDDEYTLKKLSELDGIKLINKRNGGLSSARNYGIKKSLGKYILCLDADDWINKKTVETMIDKIKNTNSPYIFCDVVLEGDKKGYRSKSYNFFEQLFVNHLPYFILTKRSLYYKVGYYDENMKLGYEDWEFNLRLAKKGYFPKIVKKGLFHYNVSTTGMLNSLSKKNHSIIFSYIQKKHKDLYNVKSLTKIFFLWSNKNRNYPLFLYLILYLLSLILPSNMFNFIYNSLYKIKKIMIN